MDFVKSQDIKLTLEQMDIKDHTVMLLVLPLLIYWTQFIINLSIKEKIKQANSSRISTMPSKFPIQHS